MHLTPAQWMEVTFNLAYLVTMGALVTVMWTRAAPTPLHQRLREGFLLLLLGDVGHVGFRVVALFLGGLETHVELLGFSIPLVGVGALATATTITVLYVLLLEAWRLRFERARDALYWGLVGLAVLRLVLFVPDGNQWGHVVPPFDWSLLRNAPLTVLGLAVAGLFLRDGWRESDATFTALGWLIVTSFAFYLPVILFVQVAPPVGMLMVPKTLAYVAMAWLVVAKLFRREATEGEPPPERQAPAH